MTATVPLKRIDLAATRVKGCCNTVAAPLPRATAANLAALHRALADGTRVQILHILKHATEPVCVCDLTAVLPCTQPTISHHLTKLRDQGMVTVTRRGIWSFYALAPRLSPAARACLDSIP